MIRDEIHATGQVVVSTYGPDGLLKSQQHVSNLVVTSGRNWMAGRFGATPPALMSHLAVGAGTVAPALTDTALGSELARVALDITTITDNQTYYKATFGPGVGTGALTEAAILNAASAGTMLARVTFAVVNKASVDTTVIEWTITQN